jgi:hypothetical protein
MFYIYIFSQLKLFLGKRKRQLVRDGGSIWLEALNFNPNETRVGKKYIMDIFK